MQSENKHKIEGVLFSSSELKNNETVLTVLEEARKLRERPEVLATLGYILEKNKLCKTYMVCKPYGDVRDFKDN